MLITAASPIRSSAKRQTLWWRPGWRRRIPVVNIDDCWMNSSSIPILSASGRSATPQGTSFPTGTSRHECAHGAHTAWAEGGNLHVSRPQTCAGFSGSWGHEAADAHQIAAWGFRFSEVRLVFYGQVARATTAGPRSSSRTGSWGISSGLKAVTSFSISASTGWETSGSGGSRQDQLMAHGGDPESNWTAYSMLRCKCRAQGMVAPGPGTTLTIYRSGHRRCRPARNGCSVQILPG